MEQAITDFPGSPEEPEERLEVQVYRDLFDRIRFGNYEMGAKLPSEAALCEEFGVSRPVVRTALAKLRDSGLIVSRQGAGSFVSSGVPSTAGGYTPLSSITDIATYFRFRRIIESASVEAAARQADKKGIGELRSLVEEMNQILQRSGETMSLDIRFHTVIAELSDNRFLVESIDMLRPHWIFVGNFVRSLGIAHQRKGKRMTDEHLAIIDAIAAGDPRLAKKTMLTHIDGSERRVFKGQE